jgi:lipid-binding SYLF domain-containing protein
MLKTLQYLLMLVLLAACAAAGDTPEQKRASIQQMRTDTLNQLTQQQPDIRQTLDSAAGYAVFSNISNKILLITGGNGYGVLHDNRDKQDTYMKMAALGIGAGVGIKNFQAVIIFLDNESLDKFKERGRLPQLQADLALKAEDNGVALSKAKTTRRNRQVKIYQLTKYGLVLDATLEGTRYWRDSDLNQ